MHKTWLVMVGLFLAVVLLLTSGCETSKCAAVGVEATTVGAVKDTQTVCNWIKEADAWIKNNLW